MRLRFRDSPEGEKLLSGVTARKDGMFLAMDKDYEDDSMREKAAKCGFLPVVPPRRNRKDPWEYDKAYKERNRAGRLLCRIKARFRKGIYALRQMASSQRSFPRLINFTHNHL